MILYNITTIAINNNMNQIPVITFHSVGFKNHAWPFNHLTIELPVFKEHIKYLAKNFNSISLKEYWQIKNGIKASIANPVVITFDDGYLDNWIWAFPLLNKYGLKATIFVSPEFVDQKAGLRPNLQDLWSGRVANEELNQSGFLSWDEMRVMETSGLVSIEAHTMSHTKYFISDRLIGFHYPGGSCVYPVGNLFPKRKPYYIGSSEFERLLPYGYPFFEETSSVIAQKVKINPEFIDAVVGFLRDHDWSQPYNFSKLYSKVNPIYKEFKFKSKIIDQIETGKDKKQRQLYEIIESKRVIEARLEKTVDFLCWPHGDYDEDTQNIAKEAGYLATNVRFSLAVPNATDRFSRLGAPVVINNGALSKLKLHHKIMSFQEEEPWHFINKIYRVVKTGVISKQGKSNR